MKEQDIKKILQTEKERLEKQVSYYKSEDPYLDKNRDQTSTLDDDITENEGHDRITAAQNEVETQLAKVNKTLERLAKGKYGVCTKCSTQIPDNRLVIMPTADLCVSCELEK